MALNRLVVVLIGVATLAFSLIFARQLVVTRDLPREAWLDRPVRVLTNNAFVAAQGPGEVLFKKFEVEHRAKLQVIVATDAMFERLKAGGSFDAVIGLDPLSIDRARAEFEWRKIEYDKSQWFEAPAKVSDDVFVAYDWSPLTFIGRRDEKPIPRKFEDLLDPSFARQFVVSDPRRTAPGLQFERWVKANAAEGTREWFRRFQPNVVLITPSWTAAYAMFEHHQTRFVWTYLTSLAFHWGTEKNRDYAPLIFGEGHPVQIEFAAVPANCVACELGTKLVTSLLEPAAQEIIMKRNFMMPARKGPEEGTVFAELPQPTLVLPPPGGDLSDWNATFAR